MNQTLQSSYSVGPADFSSSWRSLPGFSTFASTQSPREVFPILFNDVHPPISEVFLIMCTHIRGVFDDVHPYQRVLLMMRPSVRHFGALE